VVNTGNVTVEGIRIVDELEGFTFDEGEITTGITLAPGESASASGSYTVTEADILAGSVVNTATVDGVDPEDIDPDEEEVPTVEPVSDLTVDKAVTSTPANGEGYALGEAITYTITVVNTGNVTISGIEVIDELEGFTFDEGETVTGITLAPGESVTVSGSYVVTEADILAGSVVNSATATGIDPENEDPEVHPDEEEVPTDDVDTTVTVVKTSSVPEGQQARLGDEITYTITVTNDGNVTMHNLNVVDELTGLNEIIAELAVGETVTFTTLYTVVEADVAAGSVLNVATVAGDPVEDPKHPEDPKTPEGEDEIEVEVDQHLRLTVRYLLNGDEIFPAFTALYIYGDEYNVFSPELEGYSRNPERVTGIIVTDTVIDVIYTPNTYLLTILYRYENGTEAAPTAADVIMAGETYYQASPHIPGYRANPAIVTGVMPARNVTITVIYTPDRGTIPIDDYDTPLGLGNVGINVGDCYE
jgi:uncharacterized repeat protein (TIGR01451 family)